MMIANWPVSDHPAFKSVPSSNPSDGRSRFAIPGPISNPNRSRLVNSVLYAVGGEELHGERLKSVSADNNS